MGVTNSGGDRRHRSTGHAPVVAEAGGRDGPPSRQLLEEGAQVGVGVGDVAEEAGRVAELRERGARQQLLVERDHDALGGLGVRLVVVADVAGQLDRPVLYCCGGCVHALLKKSEIYNDSS